MLNSRPLPSVDSIHKRFPLPLDLKIKIQESRKGFQQFSSYHKALFIGPCSIHDLSKDLILGEKIANLQKEYPEFFSAAIWRNPVPIIIGADFLWIRILTAASIWKKGSSLVENL